MNIKKITGYLFFFSIVAIGQVTNQKVIDTNWVIMIEKKIEIDTDRVLAEKLNNILISVCKEKLAKPNLNKSERALYQNSYFLALLNTADRKSVV